MGVETGNTNRINWSGIVDFSAATVLGLHSDGKSIAYVSAIPFDQGLSSMPRQTMSANRVFTINSTNAIVGGSATIQIIADGSHSIDYSVFKEATGSSGFVNISGIINVFTFWFDGIDYWVTIYQQIGQVPIDIIPPSLSSATVENANPNKIVLTYSETLNSSIVPATTDFAASGGKTVTAVAIAGAVVTLTVDSNYLYTDTINVSYTPGTNKIQDLVGNLAVALSSQAVTNNISGYVALAVTTNTSNLTNNGNGTYAFATSALGRGYGNKQFTGDFIIGWKYHPHGSSTGVFGGIHVNNTDTTANYAGVSHWIGDAGTNHYYSGDAGSNVADSGVAAADNDLIQLVRTGTTVVASKSSDGGSTWTTIKTWTGLSGTFYAKFTMDSNTVIGNSHLLDTPMQQGGS